MLDTAALIGSFGILGIALIVFAESGLFFGFFLPGDSLLFTAGLLASKGHLPLPLLICAVVVAAIAGDSVGYWFGNKMGPRIFSKKDSFWFSAQRVEQTRRFFDKNGAKSIVLARFIPAIRTFTPILAGVAGLSYRKFLTYNILGGLIWGVGILICGFYLGGTVPGIDRYLLPIVLFIMFISFLPLLLEILKRRK